jgi:hypothetical protein
VLTPNLTGDCSLRWVAHVECLICGEPMQVQRGSACAVLKSGTEVIGVSHDACLDEDSQQRLQQLRDAVTR